MLPPPLKPDSQANFQALNAQLGDSCSAPILEPERSALIQEALADSQLQAVKAQLEGRGLGMNADEAQAVRLVGGEQLVIPFGQDAHLVWTRTNGQTAAIGLVRQGNKTLNVGADGQERVVRFLSAQQAEKLLRKLREKGKFQDFEGKLAQKGKRVGKVRVLFDETNKIAILGIASEGSDEKIAHQVRIKVKADKDDEPEDDAEPAIQGTACGQATGEAVPTGARMQPLALPSGGGDFEGGYEGPQICTSQWGYDYLCLSRTPSVSLSTTSLALPQTFINQQVQASFTIWNGGGGTLTGTVSAQAPFSIVSGGSFSLLPGQPQEVVVRFSSGTAGSFSKSIAISSNGGSATVTATGVAHKVSFSPAQVDFGSGLFVLREQCDDTGGCKLRTEKVGLPIEKALTVKNEGTVSVSLTLSTAGPYKIVSVLPTLSPGQSGQVTLRFDPSESGTFTGTVQVGINGEQGSVTSSPMTGVAHKIEIDPAILNFRLIFTGRAGALPFTVKNQGVTSVALTASTDSPFSIVSSSSFTLAPSESRQMTVQFSPTGSGDFTGSLRLAVGAATKVVPITATSRTVAEFLQMLSNLNDPLSSVGDYHPMLYVENVGYQLDMILAGFTQLAEEDLNNWLASAQELAGSGATPDPQLVEALRVIESIGAETIAGWLSQLAQAAQENRFDEVYDSLLTQGFNQFEQVIMALLGTSNQNDARGFFFRVVLEQEIIQPPAGGPSQSDPEKSVLFAIINAIYQRLYGSNEGQSRAIDWMGKLDRALNFWGSLLPTLCNGASCVDPESDPLRNAYKQISRLINKIRFEMGLSPELVGKIADRFAAFFQWASENRDPAEVSFGTLQVAINAGAAGWVVLGPVNGRGQLLGPGNENAFLLIRGQVIDEKLTEWKILGIVRGDACTNCNTDLNRLDIISWLNEAASFVKNTKPEEVGGQMGDTRMVALVFTRGGNSVERLLESLARDRAFLAAAEAVLAATGMPVIIVWRGADGRVYFDCTNQCKDKNGNPIPVKVLQALSCAVIGRECGVPTRKQKLP
jgi:hypothetical protein